MVVCRCTPGPVKTIPLRACKVLGIGRSVAGDFCAGIYFGRLCRVHGIRQLGLGNWLCACVGIIIFNFDRFLVSTMRKYGISKRKQLWMAVPRLILALLIGFTIARPLELKIFEKEINVKMTENLHKKIQRNDSLLALENNALINAAGAERQRLNDRRLAIENELQNLQTSYVQEADGTGGSGQRGIEKLTHLKLDAYNK